MRLRFFSQEIVFFRDGARAISSALTVCISPPCLLIPVLCRHLQQAAQVNTHHSSTRHQNPKPHILQLCARILHPLVAELHVSRSARAQYAPSHRPHLPLLQHLPERFLPVSYFCLGPPKHHGRQIHHQPGAPPPPPFQVVARHMVSRCYPPQPQQQ